MKYYKNHIVNYQLSNLPNKLKKNIVKVQKNNKNKLKKNINH